MSERRKLQPHQCYFLSVMKTLPLEFNRNIPTIFHKFSSYENLHKELHWSERGWFTNFDRLANAIFHLILQHVDRSTFIPDALWAINDKRHRSETPYRYRYVWLNINEYRAIEVAKGQHWYASEQQALDEGGTKCPSVDLTDDVLILTVESVCCCDFDEDMCYYKTGLCPCNIELGFPSSTLMVDDEDTHYTPDNHKTVVRAPYMVNVNEHKMYLFHVDGGHWYVSFTKNVKLSFENELMKRLL